MATRLDRCLLSTSPIALLGEADRCLFDVKQGLAYARDGLAVLPHASRYAIIAARHVPVIRGASVLDLAGRRWSSARGPRHRRLRVGRRKRIALSRALAAEPATVGAVPAMNHLSQGRVGRAAQRHAKLGAHELRAQVERPRGFGRVSSANTLSKSSAGPVDPVTPSVDP